MAKLGRKPLSLISLACLLAVLPTSTYGLDKSGVKANAISLPTGPGSIEGLGESFEPNLNTGTAKYGVSLTVPPGTAGHAPIIMLNYDGGGANGCVGFGWSLPMPLIQRQCDKGIPRYVDGSNGLDDDLDGEVDEADEIDIFINEFKEELVPQADGFYFCENEGAFIRYRRLEVGWEGVLPSGTRMEFGTSERGQVRDRDTGRIYKWLCERRVDTHGNTITYTYESFPGEENLNQKYCVQTRYGPGAPPWENYHFVVYEYEDRLDWFEDGRAGFLVRTGKRLKEMVVGTQGPELAEHLSGDFSGDGKTDYLNRKYALSYLDYAPGKSHWSLLSEVVLVGADGKSTLPPSRFNYAVCNPPEQLSALGKVIRGENEPVLVMDSALVDLVDLNGDGLPDMLRTERFGGEHVGYINQGEGGEEGSRVIRWGSGKQVESEDGLAHNINLESENNVAHLSDMDGDGLADLVYRSAVGEVHYFRNKGSLKWGTRQAMSVQDEAPPSPFDGNEAVKSADVDFDKNMDVIQSMDTGEGAGYRVWFNLGQRRYSKSRTVEGAQGVVLSGAGVELSDVNGDRVVDLVKIRPTSVEVRAGLGYGAFAELRSVEIPSRTLTDEQVRKAKLEDVTGDGLVDLVLERAGPGELWYWVNLGNYSLSEQKRIVGMPTGFGLGSEIRWADMNGNGTRDLVYADRTNESRVQVVDIGALMGCVPRPNTLVRIENGTGRITKIGYESSTKFLLEDARAGKPWAHALPFPVQVVSEVITDDSLGNEYVTRYRYHDGYYDGVEKEFRGFGHVEQIDVGDETAPTLVSRMRFDVGQEHEALKGKLVYQSAEEEDGDLFWEEETRWTNPPRELMVGISGQRVNFAHPLGTRKVIKELGLGDEKVLETALEYDQHGNETRNANYGIVEGENRSAYDDERVVETEYALNLEKWLLRYPSRTEIMDEHGEVISRVESYYDEESFSGNNFGEVTIGNLTIVREWHDPDDSTGFIESARTKYDVHGNPTRLLDPLSDGNVANGHVREVTYDDRFQTYPIRESIYLGDDKPDLIVRAGYDEGFGVVIDSVDYNSHQTSYKYDEFARLVRLIKPGDNETFPTVEYSYALAVRLGKDKMISHIETRMLDRMPDSAGPLKQSHYFFSRQFVDGLGRILMTKEEAEVDPDSQQPRVAVRGAVQFNARMGVSYALNPFYSVQGETLHELLKFEDIQVPGWQGFFHEDGLLVKLGLGAAHRLASRYDAMTRPLRTINQDGTAEEVIHEPLIVKSFDEHDVDPASPFFGTPSVAYLDGLGRLIRSDDLVRINDDGSRADRLNTWTTYFEYDLNDQLTKVIDPQENSKLMAYDGLRRKIFSNDPNRGRTSYVYDDASNIIETTDAKAQRITYDYDGVNRLVSEEYHDELSSEFSYHRSPDVLYFYDIPLDEIDFGDGSKAISKNTKGALAYVFDTSGEEHLSYDERGRVAYVVKRVREPETGNLVSYSTQYRYDSMDRLIHLTYPDNDVIEYKFNNRNLLEQISGTHSRKIISDINYTPLGQVRQCQYGNGMVSSYAFDVRMRMNSLTTTRGTNGIHPLIAYQYTLDNTSNIVAIEDKRPKSVISRDDPRRNTQVFQYDDMYRLTQVKYSFSIPGEALQNDGRIDYRYDRLGNMLFKGSPPSGELAHIQDTGDGRNVVNIGTMESGGELGRFSRFGRVPGDAPGPGALTSTADGRELTYDDNGNLTSIDDFTLIWDFKDRLVAVESDEMRSEYTYDYTDSRVTKKVTTEAGSSSTGSSPMSQAVSPRESSSFPDVDYSRGSLVTNISLSSIYVNQYFEVREHQEPVKYVFQGSGIRVARVTGTLSAVSNRVQRFKARTGWNLFTVAVEASDAAAQLGVGEDPDISACYRWDFEAKRYVQISQSDTLPTGSVFWLKSDTDKTLQLRGEYAPDQSSSQHLGDGYVPHPRLSPLRINEVFPQSVDVWKYNSLRQVWDVQLSESKLGRFDLPPSLISPGDAVFVVSADPYVLEISDNRSLIEYYHQDHLTSSQLITNGKGNLLDELVYYPFGHVRNHYTSRASNLTSAVEYQYGQKEHDRETGFDYFGARYYLSPLARWLTVDPLADNYPNQSPYSFVLNHPINYRDPDGRDPEDSVEREDRDAWAWGIVDAFADLGQGIGNLIESPLETIAGIPEALWEHGEMVVDTYANIGNNLELVADSSGDEIAGAATYATTTTLIDVGTARAGSVVSRGLRSSSRVRPRGSSRTPSSSSPRRSSNGPECFVAGTLIATQTGLVSIEEIRVGDLVWAFDEVTGWVGLKEVRRTFSRTSTNLIRVYVDDKAIETTDEHPFWIHGTGWVQAGMIEVGDTLKTYSNQIVYVSAIEKIAGKFKVYNLEVSQWHTFLVTELGLLVHNNCGPMWTSTKNRSRAGNAYRHFRDHGADFGARNALEYVRMAQDFLRNPPPGTLTRTRPNGDVVRYNPHSDTFGVMDSSGAPRTMYIPDPAIHGYPTNLDYFYAQ